jgi:hypothetical protein
MHEDVVISCYDFVVTTPRSTERLECPRVPELQAVSSSWQPGHWLPTP